MQDRGLVRKMTLELPGEHGGQGDLRHEPDGSPPGLERRPDRAQVHLGLSTSRDTLEQRREVTPVADRGSDGLDRHGLRRGRFEGRNVCLGRGACVRFPGLLEGAHEPLRRERSQHLGSCPGLHPDLRRGGRAAKSLEEFEDIAAAAAATECLLALGPGDRSGQVGELDPGGPGLARGHGADPASLLEGAQRLPPLSPLSGQLDHAHRLTRRQAIQDRALGRRGGSGQSPLLRHSVTHRAGRREPRRQGALQDLTGGREEALGHASGRDEQLRRAHRLGVQHLEDVARRRHRRAGLLRQDHSRQDALPERDADAYPWQRKRESVGNRVREAAAQRQRQGHRDRTAQISAGAGEVDSSGSSRTKT